MAIFIAFNAYFQAQLSYFHINSMLIISYELHSFPDFGHILEIVIHHNHSFVIKRLVLPLCAKILCQLNVRM